jgi:hypothetical protein
LLIDSNTYAILFLLSGIENQSHCQSQEIAVFIQTISQFKFIRGHPLFQGFMAASVCNKPVNFSVPIHSQEASILLFLPLITQSETEF